MELERTVGANVRRLRLARGWTQERLAQEAEITTRYVGMVERGQTSVTVGMLGKLAKVLGLEANELLTTR